MTAEPQLTEARATKDMWKERYEQQAAALTTARRDALVEAAEAYRAAGWVTVADDLVHRAAQEGDPR